MRISRAHLSAWNRKRKEVGNIIGGIGLATYMTPVLLISLASPFIYALEFYWRLMEWQPWDGNVWVESANEILMRGPLEIPLLLVFGIGATMFLVGLIGGMGRRVR